MVDPVTATVVNELESGHTCLCGTFRGVPVSSLTVGDAPG
jgi:hypothetical protein